MTQEEFEYIAFEYHSKLLRRNDLYERKSQWADKTSEYYTALLAECEKADAKEKAARPKYEEAINEFKASNGNSGEAEAIVLQTMMKHIAGIRK